MRFVHDRIKRTARITPYFRVTSSEMSVNLADNLAYVLDSGDFTCLVHVLAESPCDSKHQRDKLVVLCTRSLGNPLDEANHLP